MAVYISNRYNQQRQKLASGNHNNTLSQYEQVTQNSDLDNTVVSIAGEGTGVFIAPGIILTADHVLGATGGRNDLSYGQISNGSFANSNTIASSSYGDSIGKYTPDENPTGSLDFGYIKTSTSFDGAAVAGFMATGSGTVSKAKSSLGDAYIEGYPTWGTTDSAGQDEQILYGGPNETLPITSVALYQAPVDAISNGDGTWKDNAAVAGGGNSGGPLFVQMNGQTEIAGLLNWANATGKKHSGLGESGLGAGGVLFTAGEISALTKVVQDADSNGQKSGWWLNQPTNLYYTSDDVAETTPTDDRTDIITAGTAKADIIGSLGNDQITGDSGGNTSLRYSSVASDDPSYLTGLQEISHVDLTVDLGYGYGNMAADVYDNLTDSGVSNQTISETAQVALTGHNDTVFFTDTSNPQVAGNSQVPQAGDPNLAVTIKANADGSASNNEWVDLSQLNSSISSSSSTVGQIATIDLGSSSASAGSFTLQVDPNSTIGAPQNDQPAVTMTGFSTVQLGSDQTLALSSLPTAALTIEGAEPQLDSSGSSFSFTNGDTIDLSNVADTVSITDGTVAGSGLILSGEGTIVGSNAGSTFSIGSATFDADPNETPNRYVGGTGSNTFNVDYGQAGDTYGNQNGIDAGDYDFGSGGTNPVMLIGGSGNDVFNFSDSSNSSMTIVYGGGGQDVFNFSGQNANVIELQIPNLDVDQLKNVNMQSLAVAIDSARDGYDDTGESYYSGPSVVIINPTSDDRLEYNGQQIGSVSYQTVSDDTQILSNSYINVQQPDGTVVQQDDSGTTEDKQFGFMTGSQDFSASFSGEASEQPGDEFGIQPGPYGNSARFTQLAPEVNTDSTSTGSDGSTLETKQSYYQPNDFFDAVNVAGFQPGDFGIGVSGNGPAYTSTQTGYQPGSSQGDNLLLGGFFGTAQPYTAPLADLQMTKA